MAATETRPQGTNPFQAFAAMSREAQAMLVGILINTVGTFMVVPLLALYLRLSMGERVDRIGLILTVLILANQGMPVVTGMLSDRWNARTLLSIGIVSRIAGYLGFILGHDFATFLVSALLVGVGGAAFTPTAKAVLARSSGALRLQAFALRSAAVNIGAALGPLIGGLFFVQLKIVFVAAIALLALYLMAVWITVRGRGPIQAARQPIFTAVIWLLRDWRLLSLTIASAGFWYLYTQFNFTFSMYSHDAFGWSGQVGLLFAANALIVLSLQYVILARVGSDLVGWTVCALGATMLALGFTSLAAFHVTGALVLFTVLFSLGELLIVPMLDTLASEIAPLVTVGGYLGFVSLGWAAGGLLGNLGGGTLYATARSQGTFAAFWGINALVAVVTALSFLFLGWLIRTFAQSASESGVA